MSLEDDDFALRTSTIGSTLPHVEIKVVDPESLRILPVGQKGEILVRGYLTMLGYFNDPAKTGEVFVCFLFYSSLYGTLAISFDSFYLSFRVILKFAFWISY